jgi:hypothetical protein
MIHSDAHQYNQQGQVGGDTEEVYALIQITFWSSCKSKEILRK